MLCKLCVVNLCLLHCCNAVLCNLLTLHSVLPSAQRFLCTQLCELCASGVCVAFANQNCKLCGTACNIRWRREPESNRPTRICNPRRQKFQTGISPLGGICQFLGGACIDSITVPRFLQVGTLRLERNFCVLFSCQHVLCLAVHHVLFLAEGN